MPLAFPQRMAARRAAGDSSPWSFNGAAAFPQRMVRLRVRVRVVHGASTVPLRSRSGWHRVPVVHRPAVLASTVPLRSRSGWLPHAPPRHVKEPRFNGAAAFPQRMGNIHARHGRRPDASTVPLRSRSGWWANTVGGWCVMHASTVPLRSRSGWALPGLALPGLASRFNGAAAFPQRMEGDEVEHPEHGPWLQRCRCVPAADGRRRSACIGAA